MFDFIAWEASLGAATEATIDSPAINGRLLRLKVTASGPGFSEGTLLLYSNGKQLAELADGFSGCDVMLRLPVQVMPQNLYADAQYADGYPVVEAPVLWGPLRAVVGTNDTPGTTWRFEAIVER